MLKFAIWGAGDNGTKLFRLLGRENIVIYIDGNPEREGEVHNDIPVVSFETYKEKYSDMPIIISPKRFHDEINAKLYHDGVKNIFNYVSENPLITAFFLNIDKEIFIKRFLVGKKYYIYGYTLFGLMLYEYLSVSGYDCEMLVDEKWQSDFLEGKIKVCTSIAAQDKDTGLILTKALCRQDVHIVKEQIIDLSTLEVFREFFRHPELKKFKNIHEGEKCFIVATGPSLRVEDLDVLHKNKVVCFSLNQIYKAYPQTEWRPHYYMISDPNVAIRCEKEWACNIETSECFLADWAFYYDDKEGKVNKWHVELEYDWNDGGPKFSDDFSEGTYTGYTVVYDGALQLAVYMGFKEIYLLGTDCNYSDPKGCYFMKNMKFFGKANNEQKMICAYQSAKKYADEHNIKIYNATRGGALEVFERVDFDSLFEKE